MNSDYYKHIEKLAAIVFNGEKAAQVKEISVADLVARGVSTVRCNGKIYRITVEETGDYQMKPCPKCGSGLQQLGTLKGVDRKFVPENLWRCYACPYGANRYLLVDGKFQLDTQFAK
jgi:hypothetical protein